MSPLSLLFSSDEETSRRLGQTLTELEFQVEFCPEIFAAIEKLTSKSFDVIMCDWNEGPEAAFLLKTSRELKLNRSAFTVVIARPEAGVAAQRAGADLVLSKPVMPESAKYALLTCDLFLQRMRSWLPKLGFQAEGNGLEYVPRSKPAVSNTQLHLPRSPEPSRLPPIPEDAKMLPVIPAFAFGSGSYGGSGRRSILGLDADPHKPAAHQAHQPHKKFLGKAALTVVFIAVGYACSEPLRSQGLAASIVAICGRALERTQALLREDKRNQAPDNIRMAQGEAAPWRWGRITRIKVNPAGKATGPSATGAANPSFSPSQSGQTLAQAPPTTMQASIPQSLRMSLYGGAMRSVATQVAPSLLAALEPVSVPEGLSERLILEKVAPGYPEQALRAGLQGSVVLEALIGRDGNIRDIKLIRGSFLLGKAAYQAVRQWRYQPWVVNGRAVEAQTFVTVDFRLPQVSQSAIAR
jgi:TonB family protein